MELTNKELTVELKQFIAYAQKEGIIKGDVGKKLVEFSEYYVGGIVTCD